MTQRRLAPPSGFMAPTEVSVGAGAPLDVRALAREISRRYYVEFPGDTERYGETGAAWCVHDNQHILNWAAGAVRGDIAMLPEVAWLAKVLEARGYPLDQLVRDLEIAGEVVKDEVGGPVADQLADVLAGAAAFVAARDTFLEP